MNASTPLVGVVDLPALASVLTQAGYTVITGDAPRAAAAAIRENLNAHGPFPVIIFDSPWAGHRAWSDKISQETTTVVVRGEFGQPNTKFTGPILIDLPAPLYEIAAAAGLPLSPEASEMTMLTNGHISGQPQPQPVVPAGSPVAQTPPLAPATYEAAPTPEPAPVAYDESTMTAPTVMQPESAPAPAFSPGLDGPWGEQGVPAPEQPVHTAPAAIAPEPTPPFTAPSFPDAPAPVFEQPVAPAFPEPPAPAFEAPAAPVYQPVAEAPAFEAPAAPAFPEPPAPAFDAPAVPVYQPVAEAPAFEAPIAPVAPSFPEAPAPVFEQPAAPAFPEPPAPAFEAPAFEPPAPVAPSFPEPPAPVAPAAPVYQPVAEVPAFEPPAVPVAPSFPEPPAAPVYQPVAEAPAFEPPAVPVAPSFPEPPAAPVYQPVAEAPAFEPPAVPVAPSFPEPPAAPVYQPVAEAPAFEPPAVPVAPSFPEPPAAPVYQPVAEVPAFEPPAVPVAPSFPEPPAAPVYQPVAEVPAFEPPAFPEPPAAPVYQQPAPVAYEAPVAPVAPVPPAPVMPQAPTFEAAPVAAPQALIQNLPPATHFPAVDIPPVTGDGLAEVVVVYAGKGGVGKTTTSVGLAHSASARGLRVILIDGNRGQGDIRKFLRLDMAALPSVLNFAATNSLRDTLIDPTRLNEARVGQDPLRFAVVTAAPSEAADDSVVTPEVYLRLVQECRKVCDLVVIDTQIIEPKKTVDEMVARFVNPLVRAGAWSIGVADLSNPGISNLLTRLKRVASMNVPRERTLTMLNRVPSDLEFNRDGIAQAFGEHSLYMGIVYSESGITEVMNLGGVPGSHPAIGDLLNSAVSYFRPEWAQLAAAQVDQAPEPVASGKKSRFGLRRK